MGATRIKSGVTMRSPLQVSGPLLTDEFSSYYALKTEADVEA